MKTVYITNLGCKVNQYESQALKKAFRSRGWIIADKADNADACVINTCSVTSMADRKSRQIIRQCRSKSAEAIIAVTGCYVQTGTEDVCEMAEANIIIGTNRKIYLPDCVENLFAKKNSGGNSNKQPSERIVDVLKYDDITGFEEMGPVVAMEGKTRAFIKIQEGCNRFCSYCIIPFARGKVRSRTADSIIEEAKLLIESGYKEIVLTGINTALYGAEEDGNPKIDKIIKGLNDIEGDFRIRLSSLEPTVINAEYIKKLFEYDKLCHHIHLSLQSGSDFILKAMNRLYSQEEYMDIVSVIKEFDENYGITTDIIVGFPGETEADFDESLKVVTDVDFCKVHGFKYSSRKGTAAADLENSSEYRVDASVKHDRIIKLSKIAEESGQRFVQKNLNTQRVVLFEEMVKTEHGNMLTGYTDNYIRVYLPVKNKVGGEEGKLLINTFQTVSLDQPLLDGILCSLL